MWEEAPGRTWSLRICNLFEKLELFVRKVKLSFRSSSVNGAVRLKPGRGLFPARLTHSDSLRMLRLLFVSAEEISINNPAKSLEYEEKASIILEEAFE